MKRIRMDNQLALLLSQLLHVFLRFISFVLSSTTLFCTYTHTPISPRPMLYSHLYYDHYYDTQDYLFRGGANDGFHEAIGDTIRLSVNTPDHLKEVGLLQTVEKGDAALLNYQMSVALDKIAFLPFGFLVDKYRWDIFSGSVKPEDFNSHW